MPCARTCRFFKGTVPYVQVCVAGLDLVPPDYCCLPRSRRCCPRLFVIIAALPQTFLLRSELYFWIFIEASAAATHGEG